MLATFNLQLSTLDLSAETPAPQGNPSIHGGSERAGFAAKLQLRVDDAAAIDAAAGDALPPAGRPLPGMDISITVDGMALESGGETESPFLSTADLPPWESHGTRPGLESSELTSEVALAFQSTATPEASAAVLIQASSLTAGIGLAPHTATQTTGDALQGASALAAQTAASKPRLTPLPVNSAVTAREIIADARDTRIAPGVQVVVPREIQPREVHTVQGQQNLVLDDGQPVLQGTVARPAAAPLQQAAPMVEQLAEPPRPVVQPGVSQATVAAPALQPGAVAHSAPAPSQGDSAIGSALQQQVSGPIETPVRDGGWGDRFGERVVMMANNQLKTAEIRLTPAELGPVRVQVNVEDGAANITFHAQHAITREAIEQALPRLREMFAESGLSLGQASVGEQNVAGNRDGNARGEARTTGQGSEFLAADDETETRERLTRRHEGLLDTFV